MVFKHCNLKFVSGSSVIKGVENVLISNVMTKVPDYESDDDVIEVVRDDAPIEILSDGEELELEKIKQAEDDNTNVTQSFHFTSVSSETNINERNVNEPNINEPNLNEPNIDVSNIEVDTNRCEEDHIIDPLTNTETFTNDIPNYNNLLPFENPMVPSLDSTTDKVNENKSNHDEHDEENVYVNVTDDVNMNEPTQSDMAMDLHDNNDQIEQNQTPVENSCNSVNNSNDVPGDLSLKASENVTENK